MDIRRWQCLHGSTLAFVHSDLAKSTSSSKKTFLSNCLPIFCAWWLYVQTFFFLPDCVEKVRWWHHSRASCPTAYWSTENVNAAEGCPTAYLLSWRLPNSLLIKRKFQCRWGPFCHKLHVVRGIHHPNFNQSDLVTQISMVSTFKPHAALRTGLSVVRAWHREHKHELKAFSWISIGSGTFQPHLPATCHSLISLQNVRNYA